MDDASIDSPSSQRKFISLSRRVFNEQEFRKCYVPKPLSKRKSPALWRRFQKHLCKNIASLTFKGVLFSWFPILSWLPKYKVRENIVADIAGGFTVAVLHIPQGLAYALLASLPPITGLYHAVVPLLVYLVLGTSRHLSLGTFAVVCLMIGTICDREVQPESVPTTLPILATHTLPVPMPMNTTPSSFVHLILKVESNSSNPSAEDILSARKMEVAVTLALMIGIIQFIMGIMRLGFIAVYLSDPLVSGFTTGAAILVLTSQIKHIFGISVPRYSGAFAAIKTYIYIFSHIADAIPGAIITGVVCIVLLVTLKKIDEKTRKFIKFPIPADLIVVVLGTGITYGAATHKKYDISVLEEIPKGLPPISIPSLDIIGNILPDAFVIAIVIFATNISLAKMFAQKHKYTVDPNQELIAYGAANIIGSFFSCFPVAGSLSRSAVQESLAKTLLCNLPVVVVIILVLLLLAPLFYCLPKAVLAGVIIVALKGLLLQFTRLRQLWKICKPDAVVWLSTWLAVVLLGIDTGLAVGIVVALLVVLLRAARPQCVILGRVAGTEIYRDIRRFPGATEIPGIKIFRFESAVFYANVEYFRSALIRKSRVDPQDMNRNIVSSPSTVHYKAASVVNIQHDCSSESDEPGGTVDIENRSVTVNGDVETASCGSDDSSERDVQYTENIHTIIIDGSTFNFIDTQGVNTLIQLALEYERIKIKFYLASCRHNIRKMLDKAHFTRDVGNHHVFISVHDAVVHALQPDQEVLSYGTNTSLCNAQGNSGNVAIRRMISPSDVASSSEIDQTHV